MEMNNLEEKASKMKSIFVDEDPYMNISKISESTGVNMTAYKKINGEAIHIAYLYPFENKILVSNEEYRIFFENLKEKYKKNFNQDLKVGEWKGYALD